MIGVGGVRKSIYQIWLAKGLGLGLLYSGFKGVQEEIQSEEACTLQIGSVAFPAGQCSSEQLHRCHRLFDQDGHQDRGCRYETIEEMKEAVTKVIDTLTQEDFHGAFQKLLERYNKCIAAGGDYFEGNLPIRKKSGNLFNDPRNTLQKKSERHTPNDAYENFITAHIEAAADYIPTKPTAKCRVPWEAIVVREQIGWKNHPYLIKEIQQIPTRRKPSEKCHIPKRTTKYI